MSAHHTPTNAGLVVLYLYASRPTVMLRPRRGRPVTRSPATRSATTHPTICTPTPLGVEIRRIRHEQGISQRSLRRFEEGQSRGNLQLVEAVADALGYELELMFRGFAGGIALHPLPPDPPER
jgi:hypothetical protein